MDRFFTECEIVKTLELEGLKGGLCLPFVFHIKDVNDIGEDVFAVGTRRQKQYKIKLMEKNILEVLDYVDYSDLTIDIDDGSDALECFDDNGIEYIRKKNNTIIIKNPTSLYNLMCLMDYNEHDFQKIISFVMEQRNLIASTFIDLVIDRLEINKKHLKFSEAFMQIQIATEFNCTSIFEENVGRSYSKCSFRELFLKRMYLSRKYYVENKKNEEAMKKNKAR